MGVHSFGHHEAFSWDTSEVDYTDRSGSVFYDEGEICVTCDGYGAQWSDDAPQEQTTASIYVNAAQARELAGALWRAAFEWEALQRQLEKREK